MEPSAYVQRILEAYRMTPGTCGAARRADRLLAAQLYERGVPAEAVENALILAAARRLIRPEGAPPPATVRALAYFSPVIEEVLQLRRGASASGRSGLFSILAHETPTPHRPITASLIVIRPPGAPAAWMITPNSSHSTHENTRLRRG